MSQWSEARRLYTKSKPKALKIQERAVKGLVKHCTGDHTSPSSPTMCTFAASTIGSSSAFNQSVGQGVWIGTLFILQIKKMT
ncbi:unnamed protein product [Ixodes pacificus]